MRATTSGVSPRASSEEKFRPRTIPTRDCSSIEKGIDDLQYDSASKRLHAIGGGVIDVLQEIDADHFRPVGSVTAGEQAKTGRLAPEINRYFAAVAQAGGGVASVQIFQPLNIPAVKPAEISAAQPMHAPRALELKMATLSAHPDLRKMGLHAIPPGGTDSVIIANANMSRIGVESSTGDLDAVKDAQRTAQGEMTGRSSI